MFPFSIGSGFCRSALLVFSVLLLAFLVPRLCNLGAAQPPHRRNRWSGPEWRRTCLPPGDNHPSDKEMAARDEKVKARLEEMKSNVAELASWSIRSRTN